MYICLASRGSILIECNNGPSGVPPCGSPTQSVRLGFSLNPSTPCHVFPPSSLLNNPCGDVPAYHTSDSEGWPGVNQKVCLTARASFSSVALLNAGGLTASCQFLPPSVER